MPPPASVLIGSDARRMLGALIAMGVLQLVMLGWMYATRIPAMKQAKMRAQATETPGVLQTLPKWARNPAANYTNLFEAPTVFYAVIVAIVLLGLADAVNVWLAWAYVAARAVHSFIQASLNIVMWRFAIFSLSWVVLGTLILRTGFQVC